MPHVTARPPSRPLESDVAQIAACHPHSRGAQSCSRRALTTAHVPWRMATPSPDNPADLESIQGSSGGPVCFPRLLPLPAVLLPDRGPPRYGHAGHSWPRTSMYSPSKPPRTDTVQGQGGRVAGLVGCAFLAHQDLVSRTHAPRNSPSLAHPPETGPSLSGLGTIWPDLADLSPAVVNTLYEASLCSEMESVRKLVFFSPRRPPKMPY